MAMFSGWRITRVGILFVIGVLVLGGLVFAGVSLVKQRGEQVRRDEAVKIAEQNLKNESESVPASEGATSGAAPAESAEDNKPAATSTVATTGGTSTELPQTGLEGVGSILAVTALSLSVAFYVASRRAVRES